MKNNIKYLIFLFSFIAVAQNPNWVVNENSFEFSMTRVAFLNVNGVTLNSANDQVAAFVNGEVRGVAKLSNVSSSQRMYAYLTVFSNTDGVAVNYKIYDSTNDQVIDVPATESFQINNHKGDLFQAFSIASPTLNSAAQIIDFSFVDEEELDVIVNDSEVIIKLDDSIDVSSLLTTFELSTGAQLLQNGQQVNSGTAVMDFSATRSFQVRSQDESQVKDWTVKIESIPNAVNNAQATFFKKDAVCHTLGAIKVSFPINGTQIFLTKDGQAAGNATVVDGTVLFQGLDTGNYVVGIGINNKSITINLNN